MKYHCCGSDAYVATNAVHMLDYLAEGVSNLVVLISVGETRKKSNKTRIVTTSVINNIQISLLHFIRRL